MKYWKLIGILFISMFSAVCGYSQDKTENQVAVIGNRADVYEAFYETRYGKMPFNTFMVQSTIAQDEFLSTVFDKVSISQQTVLAISNLPDSLFNEKRIRVGNEYAFVFEVASKEIVPYQFIYQKNKIDFAVINFDEKTVQVAVHQKPIDIVERISSGVILSSLYQTMVDDGANPLLAIELSEIYAWTIDFYRIQKKDFFKVIYTEKFVENESIGVFDIKASVFNHFGHDNFAFLYHGDSITVGRQFYDEAGNSLRSTFLQAPVAYSRISSKFTYQRFHPVTGVNKPHLGTDYAAPTGTPIYSTADGVVTVAQYKQYNGNYVKVQHNKMYTTQYLHMSKIEDGIAPGVFVEQGQVIGYVGQTGLATGPHVCYRFWKNGEQVDPYAQDLAKAEPLDSALVDDYLEFIEPIKARVDSIEIVFPTVEDAI